MDAVKKYYIGIILDNLGPVLLLADVIPVYFLSRGASFLTIATLTSVVFALNFFFLHRRCLYPFLAWGLIAGTVVALRYDPNPSELPQGFSKATALEGTLEGDGRLTKGGSYIYDLRIDRVCMGNISMDYPYSATVFACGEKGFWGERVRFEKVRLGKDGRSFSAGRTIVSGDANLFYKIRRGAVVSFTKKIGLVYGRGSFLAEALLTGSRDNLDPQIKELFRKAGVSHVLALSGMHLGIIALFVHFIVSRIAGPRLAVVLVNAVNVLYLLLAGLSPSLLRAVIMFFLASLGKLTGQKIDIMRILIFTFTLLLMAFPSYFFSLSFQLSFLALGGLLLLTAPISSLLERFLGRRMAPLVACSVGAVVMTSAVSLYSFGVIYPAGIVTSMIISPVVTIYMCLGLALALLPSAFFVAIHLVQQNVFMLLYSLIRRIVGIAALVPGVTALSGLQFPILMLLQLSLVVLLWRIRRFR